MLFANTQSTTMDRTSKTDNTYHSSLMSGVALERPFFLGMSPGYT